MPAALESRFEIREFRPPDAMELRRMYETFQPRGAAKGLPPVRADKLTRWLQHLEGRGYSLVAVHRADGRVAGHVALVQSSESEAELAVFVHQEFRGHGLGTALGRAAVQHAEQHGCRRLWATVSPGNSAAVRMVRACGFRTIPSSRIPDLEMELVLENRPTDAGPSSIP